jgi:hypothetical protein
MPLAAEDLEQIKGLITESIGPAVNNMFTARLATTEEKLVKKLEKQLGESFGKTLDDKLAGFKPAQDPPDDKGGGKGKKDVELESMRKTLENMQQQLQATQAESQAEKEKNRTIQLQQLVTEKLEKLGGIQGVAARMALGSLTAFNKVGWGTDEDTFGPDKLVFRNPDDGSVTDLDVGLKQWLKTDEAKIFQAPTGVRGSGSRPGGGDPRLNGGKLTLEQQKQFLQDALERDLG